MIENKDFFYHDRFSNTMRIVSKLIIEEFGKGKSKEIESIKVLDFPAGAGRLSENLRNRGFSVTSADINEAKQDYIIADMNKALPFDSEEYDAVICMEGIEHIFETNRFIKELSRITKRGGLLILTLPNISCYYSRLMFICTGNFFQFWPTKGRHNIDNQSILDYGHINPIGWQQIVFLFEHHGVSIEDLYGNKIKRKIFLPAYIPFILLGFFWLKRKYAKELNAKNFAKEQEKYYKKIEKLSFKRSALLSRNIILKLRKK